MVPSIERELTRNTKALERDLGIVVWHIDASFQVIHLLKMHRHFLEIGITTRDLYFSSVRTHTNLIFAVRLRIVHQDIQQNPPVLTLPGTAIGQDVDLRTSRTCIPTIPFFRQWRTLPHYL